MKRVSVLVIVCGFFLFIVSVKVFSASTDRDIIPMIKLKFVPYLTAGGSIMEATFTIDNQSSYDIKDIEITCTHSAKSGTEIDSNTRTIYDIVKAKKKKTFKNFNMGFVHSQVSTTSCRIVDLKAF